jgi:hypothetical protein
MRNRYSLRSTRTLAPTRAIRLASNPVDHSDEGTFVHSPDQGIRPDDLSPTVRVCGNPQGGPVVRKLWLIACVAFAAAAASTSTPARAALSCSGQTMKQPFLPWLDPLSYVQVQNGSLESTSGWTLTGGAAQVSGNEPWYVNSSTDRKSLALPSGSSATSPALCITLLHPTVRFFATNSGSLTVALKVEAVTDINGSKLVTPIGVLVGGGWQPTLPLPLLTNLTSAVTGSVQFRFTPIGLGTSGWRIDDVYVDPFKDR